MRILISLATATVILAVALLLLLTPFWTHFALDQAGSVAPAGRGLPALEASDQTVTTLVTLGRFDFVVPPGVPMYAADEQSHMRDVQVVLYGFLTLALASLVFVIVAVARAPRDASRWRALSRGGIWLIVGVIVLGVFAATAFESAFTLFHEIFFPGGNWAFPDTSNLIRLYPEEFWELSTAALGILSIIGGLSVWFLARRHARNLEMVAVAAPAVA